jgi:uncharacterized membrane protein YsdA (DUF1294 family)
MLLTWIAAVSVATFAATAYDKYRARKGHWRVPEARLLTLALIGGSPGLIAGMLLFRHKTSKLSFRIAAGAIVVLHLALLTWYLFKTLN